MSWLYSQALVAEYLEGTCSDGAPFAPSSGSPTPQAYLPPDKMTAFSRPSRFGMTFAPLTDDRGEELLTWFREASRARTSAQPEKAPGSTAHEAGFGEKWRELSVRYDPDSCSWKTHRCLWDEDLSACSLTLPKWGSMRNGVLLERMTLVLHIAANDAGLWRTPTVGMLNADRAKDPEYTARKEAKGQTITLADQVKNPRMWPTPKANDAEKRGNFDITNKRNGLPAAAKMWPTPLATDGSKGGPNQKGGKGDLRLSSAVHQFPTPTATNTKAHHMRGADNGKEREARSYGETGQLNPNWVEWLMGWPLGWTDLKPLEMDRCRNAQRRHGGF